MSGKPRLKKHKSAHAQNKGRPLEEALKDPTLTSGASNAWDSNNAAFNAVLTEMGLPISNQCSYPTSNRHSPPMSNKHSESEINLQINNNNNKLAGNSSGSLGADCKGFSLDDSSVLGSSSGANGKRSPTRGEGVSPNAKKPDLGPGRYSKAEVQKCKKNLSTETSEERERRNLKLNALKELKNSKRTKSAKRAQKICDTDEKDNLLCDIIKELKNETKLDEQENMEVEIEEFPTQCASVANGNQVGRLESSGEQIQSWESTGDHIKPQKSSRDQLKPRKSSGDQIMKERIGNQVTDAVYKPREEPMLVGETCDKSETLDALGEGDNGGVDTRELLDDIISELKQSTPSVPVKVKRKRRPQADVGHVEKWREVEQEKERETEEEALSDLEQEFKSLSPFK